MNLRKVALSLFALFGLPAISFAGPIQFEVSASNFVVHTWDGPFTTGTSSSWVYTPASPSGVLTGDDTSSTPISLAVANYVPSNLPTPAPIDIHPGGFTHWNFEELFSVDVTVTDVASGESKVVTMGGRAHVYNGYNTADGWGDNGTVVWFLDRHEFTLGGNLYTVEGANHYAGTDPTVNVWIGSNAPVHTPEPGTLALFGLGIVPFGLRRLRRTW